jgi:murein DD-endopeptidase MepM/ murein hydrolase activator NlpD
MILGGGGKPPRRVQISRRLLRFVIVLVCLVILGGAIGLIDYVNIRFRSAKLTIDRKALLEQNARLAERSREKDEQIALVSDKLRAIELTLERIEEMEGNVRVLAGDTIGRLAGGGGPVTERLSGPVTSADVANMMDSANEIMDRMAMHQVSLKRASRYFADQISEVLQVPDQWPVRGWVTSLFGPRTGPLTGKNEMHDGMDIAAPEGTVIRAPASGRITFAGTKHGYGNVLILRHGRGITTLYGHLARILVAEGEMVSAGANIAQVGNTGRSTGPHLHYEVRINSIPVNPKRFLPEDEDEEEQAT